MKQIINGYLWMKREKKVRCLSDSVRESYLAAKWQNEARVVCERMNML